MDATRSQHHRITAYLQGKLSDTEQEIFELALMEDPALAQSMQLEGLLARGVQDYQLSASLKPSWWNNLKRSLFSKPSTGILASSLCLLVAYNVGLQQTPIQSEELSLSASNPIIFLDQLRGSNLEQVIAINNSASRITLALPVNPYYPDADYKAAIQNTTEKLLESPCITPNANGYTFFSLQGQELPSGRYQLQASPCLDDAPAQNWVLEIRSGE